MAARRVRAAHKAVLEKIPLQHVVSEGTEHFPSMRHRGSGKIQSCHVAAGLVKRWDFIGMLEGVNPFTERHFSMPDSRIMGGLIK
jgi:hypothetical protein